jgi:hypothetical protein
VDESAAAGIDRDVTDPAALGKQQEIANCQ